MTIHLCSNKCAEVLNKPSSNVEYCARSATRSRLEFYAPTILVSQLASNRQPQPAATGSILACGVQPVEWTEYRFQLILRDAWAAIANSNARLLRIALQLYFDRFAVAVVSRVIQ